MKRCSMCKKEKEETEFNKCLAKKDGLQTACRKCLNENRKNHYQKYRFFEKQSKKRRIERNRQFWRKVRQRFGCSKCQESRWYLIQAHHKTDKEKEISRMVLEGHSINSIKNELRKCILVCSNCHDAIHFGPVE